VNVRRNCSARADPGRQFRRETSEKARRNQEGGPRRRRPTRLRRARSKFYIFVSLSFVRSFRCAARDPFPFLSLQATGKDILAALFRKENKQTNCRLPKIINVDVGRLPFGVFAASHRDGSVSAARSFFALVFPSAKKSKKEREKRILLLFLLPKWIVDCCCRSVLLAAARQASLFLCIN